MISPRGRDPRLWDTTILGTSGRLHTLFVPSYPRIGQRDQFQAQGTTQVPSQSQIG